MKRKLSSNATIFVKFIFPAAWLAVWMWLSALTSLSTGEAKWQRILVGIIGAIPLFIFAFPLKEVCIDTNYLYISNYIQKIQVPITEVREVTEDFIFNLKYIKIEFTTPTVFGDKIVMMPYAILFDSFRKHPLIDELNQLVAKKRADMICQ